MFQFYVAEGKLSCQLYQRSADVFLGVPFNIALCFAHHDDGSGVRAGSQAILYIHSEMPIFTSTTWIRPGLQLSREPRPLPKMLINPLVKNLDEFKFDDFVLEGYDPHPHIKAEVSV